TMLNGEVHMRASLFGVVCIALLGAAFGPPAPPRQQKDPQKFAITIACPGTGEDRRGTTGQPLTACGTTDDKTIPVFGVVIDPTNPDEMYFGETLKGPPTMTDWQIRFADLPEGDGMILRVESLRGAVISGEVVFNVAKDNPDCDCDKLLKVKTTGPTTKNGKQKIHAKDGKI